MGLIEDLRADFDLFYSDNKAYKTKVDGISDLLGLHDKMQLRSDFLPTYIVGDYTEQRSKYVLIGMNPFFDEERNSQEENFKNGTWERYQNFVKQFFMFRKNLHLSSHYYSRLAQLFAGLDGISLSTDDQKWNYYDKNLISIDLVPYHSGGFGLPSKLSFDQDKYLNKRFDSCFDFIRGVQHKLVIMNGKAFHTLLKGNVRLVNHQTLKLTDKTTLHGFRYKEVPCIMFDWMITQPGSGVNNIHMKTVIPQFVRDCFGDNFVVKQTFTNLPKAEQTAIRSQQLSIGAVAAMTELRTIQLEFWTRFSEYLAQNSRTLVPVRPRPLHNYDVGAGDSGVHIAFVILIDKGIISCEYYVINSKGLYNRLEANKAAIEAKLGFAMTWEFLPRRKASRAVLRRSGVDLLRKDNYPDYFKWLKDTGERIIEVFPRYA